jgi:hypothetical protein
VESVSLFNGSDTPKIPEIRDKVECEFTTARLNTELDNFQADLNEVQVPLSRNDGGQDVKDGSADNVEESRTISADDPREEHREDKG